MTEEKQFITTKELAALCGLRVNDIHNMRARHGHELVPAYAVGKFYLWTREQVPLARSIYDRQKPQGIFRKGPLEAQIAALKRKTEAQIEALKRKAKQVRP